jgi:hypothetical protein
MSRALLGLALLAAATTLQAQSRTEAGREQFREAARTCRYAPPAEQRVCMAFELCKAGRDPAQCEQRYFINMERRDLVLAACKGKQGTVLNNCMRDEYKKLGTAPRLDACSGMTGAPLLECVREEYRMRVPAPKS